MCNLYRMTGRGEVERAIGQLGLKLVGDGEYEPAHVGPFGQGYFIRPSRGADELVGQIGQWGMIRPGQRGRIDYMPSKTPGRKGRPRSTNNARLEDILKRPTFTHAWRAGKRCLVPAAEYSEPNWETKKNIWWQLRRADGQPWFLAGLWWEWTDPESGEIVPNFTMLTVNCTGHSLLGRLHKPERDEHGAELPPERQDKRSLVHVDLLDWEQWLHGSEEDARALLVPQPAEVFDPSVTLATDRALQAQQVDSRSAERTSDKPLALFNEGDISPPEEGGNAFNGTSALKN